MGVSSIPLGISGGEDSVDKNKSTDDFSTQSSALVVPCLQLVGSASIAIVIRLLEGLHQTTAAYCTQALCHHVQNSPDERHLPRQKQTKGHCWVDVSSCMCKVQIYYY